MTTVAPGTGRCWGSATTPRTVPTAAAATTAAKPNNRIIAVAIELRIHSSSLLVRERSDARVAHLRRWRRGGRTPELTGFSEA